MLEPLSVGRGAGVRVRMNRGRLGYTEPSSDPSGHLLPVGEGKKHQKPRLAEYA